MAEPDGGKDSIDEEGFARELFAAMRALGHEGPYAFDPETGMFGDEEKGRLDTKALFLSLGGHPKWQRDGALRKVAEYYVERPKMPTDWSYARPRIVLTIVPRTQEESHALQHLEKPQPLPLVRITPNLAFGLGFPLSLGTLNVALEHVEAWGVTPEVAFQAAVVNLGKRSERAWVSSNDFEGVYGSAWQDGFDACRMYFPRRFLSAPLRGPAVVVLPTPNRMLFAGADDEQGLVNLGRMARSYVDKGEGTLFLRPMKVADDGESWVDWIPPRSHPARAGLRWLQARQEAMDYFHQGALVRLAANGKPVPMAMPELEVVEGDYGANVFTRTVWSDRGPAWLPKADRIVFQRGRAVLGSVRWALLVDKFPFLLKDAPGFPPRFLAPRFPEDWQLEMIGLDPPDGSPFG